MLLAGDTREVPGVRDEAIAALHAPAGNRRTTSLYSLARRSVLLAFLAAGLVGVNVATSSAHLNLASGSSINLLLVLMIAGRLGMFAATISSLVAVTCLN